mmetsp:Transcript_16747/g.50100  ORF Transcript_16747/g.50100 Transcript_16747/m.50100 type:complete len:202 (+) Transcript_16747:770-1375(+)
MCPPHRRPLPPHLCPPVVDSFRPCLRSLPRCRKPLTRVSSAHRPTARHTRHSPATRSVPTNRRPHRSHDKRQATLTLLRPRPRLLPRYRVIFSACPPLRLAMHDVASRSRWCASLCASLSVARCRPSVRCVASPSSCWTRTPLRASASLTRCRVRSPPPTRRCGPRCSVCPSRWICSRRRGSRAASPALSPRTPCPLCGTS